MSEYYEVYRKRAGHLGITPQQRALKSGRREFKQYQHYSEHTVRGLKCGEKIFDGVILTHKQNEAETSLKLLVDLCVELQVGNIIEWNEESYLIWYKTVSSYQPYNKFEIIKCDQNINWVDEEGILHSSYCHIIGSKDAKIKENFRTWNELITPQPNKFIEIIMPYQSIKKNTEIIVFDEGWRLVDYDKVSVPGVIYLSFTETKVNELTDDLNEQLANADKIQMWSISAPARIEVAVGDIVNLDYTISKNGIVQKDLTTKPNFMVGPGLKHNAFGEIIAETEGETSILMEYQNTLHSVKVIVTDKPVINGFINGNDYIRITRASDYEFVLSGIDFTDDLPFEVNDTELVDDIIVNKNVCTIKTNHKNKLGKFTLFVEYNGQVYTKQIKIISLWQEVQ